MTVFMENLEINQMILNDIDVATISRRCGVSKSGVYARKKVLLGREKRLRQTIAKQLIAEGIAIRIIVKACGVGMSWAYQVRKQLKNHE